MLSCQQPVEIFTEITSTSKSKELSGKLTLFQHKLILTYNISNYIQNTIQNVFLFILFHSAPLSAFSHIQTFTSPSGTSVQPLYLQINVCYSKIKLRGKLIISTLVLDLSTQNYFLFFFFFLSSSRNCFPQDSKELKFDCVCTKYQKNLLSNTCAINILHIIILI